MLKPFNLLCAQGDSRAHFPIDRGVYPHTTVGGTLSQEKTQTQYKRNNQTDSQDLELSTPHKIATR